MAIKDRLRNAWNAWSSWEQSSGAQPEYSGQVSYAVEPVRTPMRYSNERSIIASILTRIAVDSAVADLRHVMTDDEGRFDEEIDSPLNDCLSFEPNMDQSPIDFMIDLVTTMLDSGVACVVPIHSSRSPKTNEIFDVYTMRVGNIVAWHPKHVRVSLYNEDKGLREEMIIEKRFCVIVQNPLYNVMNQHNSTLQRLIRKLNTLDAVDEGLANGRMDIIMQLPYTVRSEDKRDQANKRSQEIEFQLSNSKYGIAWADATEKITQLNRPAENNLLKQVEWLTGLLWNQLGITEAVMNGTADEAAMLNYYNRTIEPILTAIAQGMDRALLGRQRVKRGQKVMFFRNPFKLVPVTQLAEIVDKFTRNEVLTANEWRRVLGYKPSSDPKADELRNANMPTEKRQEESPEPVETE